MGIRCTSRALLGCALLSASASAAELQLRYSGLEWSPFADGLRGTLRLEVRNVADVEVRNVDVLVAHPGVDALERPPLQFGALAPGEVRALSSGFMFSASKEGPLVWRIQFDMNGERREILLLGEPVEGGQP